MASLPGLVIKIGANTKDAIDGLNKVNGALGRSSNSSTRFGAAMRKAGPAMAAAGAAAGALAIALGTQAVRAAAEEEAELTRLNRTLGNLGFAEASDSVNQFVDDLQFSTSVADSELRPAFDRLLRSTGSVEEAQRVLGIALDASAGTGRSLQSVAEALGKAYDGNAGALGRLGIGLDKATLKSGDMDAITGKMAETFAGQAAAAADTLGGKMRILSIAADELQESLGTGIIEGFFSALSGGTDDISQATSSLRDMQGNVENIGNTIGTALGLAATAFSTFIDVVKSVAAEAYYRIVGLEIGIKSFALEVADALGIVGDEEAALVRQQLDVARSSNEAAYEQQIMAIHIKGTGTAASTATPSVQTYARGIQDTRTEAARTTTQLEKLKAQMDKFATNRSIAGQQLALSQMRGEGPDKGQNLKEFGLNYADQASRLASDIAERGNFSEKSKARARRILANARKYLGGLGLGDSFTDAGGDFLGTPGALRSGSVNTRTAGRVGDIEGRKMGTTTIYQFNGDLLVKDTAEAASQARKNARLAALNRGAVAALGN